MFASLGICIASQIHVIDRQTQSARFTLLGQTLLLGNCAWSQLVTYCNILQCVCDSHYIIFVLVLLYVIYVQYIVVSHGYDARSMLADLCTVAVLCTCMRLVSQITESSWRPYTRNAVYSFSIPAARLALDIVHYACHHIYTCEEHQAETMTR